MTANINIFTTGNSDVAAFNSGIFTGLDHDTVTDTLLRFTGVNGDKYVLKGTFTYTGVASSTHLLNGRATVTGVISDVIMQQHPDRSLYAVLSGGTVDAAQGVHALLHGTPDQFLSLFGPLDFTGNSGRDVATGQALDDSLSGGAGNDTLSGLGGNDFIQGSAGADIMSGGDGIDTLSYRDSFSRVVVSLLGSAVGGDAAGDTFTGFENIGGSSFNDRLTGDAGINVLNGALGDDTLIGGAGADRIFGGSGLDTVSYIGSSLGVTIDLYAGTASGGDATGDTLDSIENIKGSDLGDMLTGDRHANVIMGGGGNDVIDGGSNSDHLVGGMGNDRLIGGLGIDTEIGGAGSDVFVLINSAANADIIMDFSSLSDKLEISAAEFHGGLVAGEDLTSAQVIVNTTGLAPTAEARFVLNSLTGELFYDINGSHDGSTGSRLIATLHGTLAGFSHADFIII